MSYVHILLLFSDTAVVASRCEEATYSSSRIGEFKSFFNFYVGSAAALNRGSNKVDNAVFNRSTV